jgi:hypothetical protein
MAASTDGNSSSSHNTAVLTVQHDVLACHRRADYAECLQRCAFTANDNAAESR